MGEPAPTLAEEALHNTSHIPIAQLNPSNPSASSIKAIITIIWPYSSIHNTLTIGLAEPDFRLRRTQGQVRVHFCGACAQEVVALGVGSGDQLWLALKGAEWIKRDETINTPGRDIDWELKYSQTLLLEVRLDDCCIRARPTDLVL